METMKRSDACKVTIVFKDGGKMDITDEHSLQNILDHESKNIKKITVLPINKKKRLFV